MGHPFKDHCVYTWCQELEEADGTRQDPVLLPGAAY